VTSGRSMNLLSIFNYFKRYGKLAYILELNQPNLLLFTKEPSLDDILKVSNGFNIEQVKESEALNPKLIKQNDKFYELTRRKR
jgi:hypothetical protein